LVIWVVVALTTCGTRAQESPAQKEDTSLHRTWQLGGFGAGGFAPFYELHGTAYPAFEVPLNFANAGVMVGRNLTRPAGPKVLHGNLEALVELMPFWMAHYPAFKHDAYAGAPPGAPSLILTYGPFTGYGASVTPVLCRWNFVRSETGRTMPWAQMGGGLLWTNHKFPLIGAKASVINFTAQVGIGESVFLKRNNSLDFAAKAVHISNAGLGDHNPGINVSLQFSAGYSWWK
jgi:lipid A 3-O-deacylase